MVVKVRDNLDQPALERGQVRDSSPVRFCIATPSPHWSASYRGVPRGAYGSAPAQRSRSGCVPLPGRSATQVCASSPWSTAWWNRRLQKC
jgi:hypothetical protein